MASAARICLGIDPGLARVGYGVVAQEGARLSAVDYGCIETSPRSPFGHRLLEIYDELDRRVLEHAPDLLSVERLFFGRNVTTAAQVWQARGAVMLLAARRGVPVLEPGPDQIKLALCGTGGADKVQVQRMVQRFLGLDRVPTPDDTADALAAAVTGLTMDRASSRGAEGAP